MKVLLLSFALVCGPISAQQLPPGTNAADDAAHASSVSTRMKAAEAALSRGDYTSAVSLLQALAAERPKNAEIVYDLGFADERAGDESGASAAYARASELDPKMAEPLVALGLLDARGGRSDRAHGELESAARMTTASPELQARALRALALLDENSKPDSARDELLQAIRLTSETAEDLAMTGRLASRAGDLADAEAAYRRQLAADPNSSAATAALASSLLKSGKKEEAETLLRNSIKTQPNDAQLVTQLAAVYGETNRAGDGVQLLKAARSASAQLASDSAVTRMLARLESLASQESDAANLYSELVAHNTTDPLLLDEYGGVLVKLARFAEAQAVFTRALAKREAFPSDQEWAEAESHLAFAASRNHEPALALQALALRATVLPNTPSSLFLQAISYDALRENREAVKTYRSFLAVANGKYPDQEFQARHRLVALEHTR